MTHPSPDTQTPITEVSLSSQNHPASQGFTETMKSLHLTDCPSSPRLAVRFAGERRDQEAPSQYQ